MGLLFTAALLDVLRRLIFLRATRFLFLLLFCTDNKKYTSAQGRLKILCY